MILNTRARIFIAWILTAPTFVMWCSTMASKCRTYDRDGRFQYCENREFHFIWNKKSPFSHFHSSLWCIHWCRHSVCNSILAYSYFALRTHECKIVCVSLRKKRSFFRVVHTMRAYKIISRNASDVCAAQIIYFIGWLKSLCVSALPRNQQRPNGELMMLPNQKDALISIRCRIQAVGVFTYAYAHAIHFRLELRFAQVHNGIYLLPGRNDVQPPTRMSAWNGSFFFA